MEEALAEAGEALARGEFPVGCVIVHQGGVVARGRRQQSRGQASRPVNEVDHAEILALRELLDNHPGIRPSEVTVYATMEPCLMCFATLLISGVHTIVYAYEDAMGGGTTLALDQLKPLYRDMEVTIIPHVLREESLQLFKQFFTASGNPYLGDTLLAEYTLAQE